MDQATTGERYRLVFLGELLPGFRAADTRRAFQGAFTVSEAHLQRVFAGGPVVIQRSVDRTTGIKAMRRLATLGMACELQPLHPVSRAKQTAQDIDDSGRWEVARPPRADNARRPPETMAQAPMRRSRVYSTEQIAGWFPEAPLPSRVGAVLKLQAAAVLLVVGIGLALYLAVAVLAAAGVAWLALSGPAQFSALAGPGPGVLLYVLALVAGTFAVLLLLKALVAGRLPPPDSTALDPVRQRAAFQFASDVARCAGSPPPTDIRIDTGVHVTAERRGSGRPLVLTIGMPLVLGLRAHALAGVVARELAAWSSDPAMRLGRGINRVIRWLWRRNYEADLWDKRTDWMCDSDSAAVAALGGAFARGFSAVRVLLLKPLLAISRLVSRGVLEKLSLYQDDLQVRLCGAACFQRTLARQSELAAGASLAVQHFEDGWRDRKLVDNLPGLIVQLTRQVDGDEQATAARDTRAAPWLVALGESQRIAAAQDAPGLLGRVGRARRLFYSRRELCRKVTFCWYRQRGLRFSDEHLVSLADFTAAGGISERPEALGRLFGDAFSSDRVLMLPAIARLQAAEPGRLSAAAAAAQKQWAAVAPEATAVVNRREGLLHSLSNLRIARALVRGDVAIDAGEFNLPSAAPEAVDQQVGATIAELQSMERALGEFEKRQALYLATTLAAGCSQNVLRPAELLLSFNALNTLRQQASSIVELEAMSHELTTLAALAGHVRTPAVEQAVKDGTAKVVRLLASYHASLRYVQNPLNLDRTLAQEIDQWVGNRDDIGRDPVAAATAATAVARCLRHLNTGITSQLADLAERAQAASSERVANGYS
ncbi:MAG: hypothetical protein AAFN78_16475 [Pseudomonadota bacterium]